MPRFNFYFEPCQAVTVSGATVSLIEGHAVVTLDADTGRERVFFTQPQKGFELIAGEVARLEKMGAAERYGETWRDKSAPDRTP